MSGTSPARPPVQLLDSVSSTQDAIHQLGAAGAPSGTAVRAVIQTEGRGRRGNPWASPLGGLWLSVLCRLPESAIEVLSLRMALRIAAAMERSLPSLRLALKWPNDLMLADRKLGGILCEAVWQGGRLEWVAVGLGLNLANPIPPELSDRAIRLEDLMPGTTPEQLTEPLVTAIADASLVTGSLTTEELGQLRRRDWLLGRPVRAPVAGRADGIEADGQLLIRRADGVVRVRNGPVELQ